MYYQVNYNYHFPIRLIYGFLIGLENQYQLPTAFPANTEWGELRNGGDFFIQNIKGLNIEISWISIETGRTYYFRGPIDIPESVINNNDVTLLIGLSSNGEVAIWLHHELQRLLILYTAGIDISEKVTDEMIREARIIGLSGNIIQTIQELCRDDLQRFRSIPGFKSEQKRINCLDSIMRQYNYRYCVQNISPQCSIYESLSDTSFLLIDNQNRKQYHQAATPYKLSVGWIDNDDDYSAYYWMDEEKICNLFNLFCGEQSDTKMDFIIQIDVEQNKYELALRKEGLKETQIIPHDVYQILVFKNKFEHYRSDNYNQEPGAWIW